MGDNRAHDKAEKVIDLVEVIREANFREEQEKEPTFHQVYTKNLAKQEGEVLCPDLMTRWPRFEVSDGILYWLKKRKTNGMEVAQVLVPQRYWRKLV